MESKVPLFVFASSEVQELLDDNGIDLVELLRREGNEVELGIGSEPTLPTNGGYKDAPTIILASAALVVALTPVVTRIVATLAHKKVFVREMVLMPVTDAEGKVVRRANGEPELYWAPRSKFVESTENVGDMPNIAIRGFGIEVSLEP